MAQAQAVAAGGREAGVEDWAAEAGVFRAPGALPGRMGRGDIQRQSRRFSRTEKGTCYGVMKQARRCLRLWDLTGEHAAVHCADPSSFCESEKLFLIKYYQGKRGSKVGEGVAIPKTDRSEN